MKSELCDILQKFPLSAKQQLPINLKNDKMRYHRLWYHCPHGVTIFSMEKDAYLEKLGNQIRKLRKSKGLSQEQLALNAGVDRSYIGGIERGDVYLLVRQSVFNYTYMYSMSDPKTNHKYRLSQW